MDDEQVEEVAPLDSGYLTGGTANPSNMNAVVFSFDNRNEFNRNNGGSQSSRRIKTESESVYDCTQTTQIGGPTTTATTLSIESGVLYQRRQRSFSDPLPCTTKSRIRLTADYGGYYLRQNFTGYGSSSRSTQTCFFCHFNRFESDLCRLCSRDAPSPNTGFTNVPGRRVAIVAPFVARAPSLSNSDAHVSSAQQIDNAVIDDIAQNLRQIADDFDRRLGAVDAPPIVAQFGANLNLGAIMENVIMDAIRALMAAIVWLVGGG